MHRPRPPQATKRDLPAAAGHIHLSVFGTDRPARRDIGLTRACQILCAHQCAIARWRTRVVQDRRSFRFGAPVPGSSAIPGRPQSRELVAQCQAAEAPTKATDGPGGPSYLGGLVRAFKNPLERNGRAGWAVFEVGLGGDHFGVVQVCGLLTRGASYSLHRPPLARDASECTTP